MQKRILKKVNINSRVFALLFIFSAILFWNLFTHHTQHTYDYNAHLDNILQQKNSTWPTVLTNRMEHTAPYYYFFIAKMHTLVHPVIKAFYKKPYMHFIYGLIDPLKFFRLFHFIFIGITAYLYIFKFFPKIIGSKIQKNNYSLKNNPYKLQIWFTLALFLFPNLYLTQTMVRADHLTFFSFTCFFLVGFISIIQIKWSF